ncbi:aromatic ring-hydroxylating dioxygenase subunit alpha [Sporichthya sp.]|uniref:aromatic ring-hydroxylating oxygenase subunit alpha n=1 Tax=Sporichthya sp. TaxID=65475 RepID=UPI0018155A10|nr:aromatic ring-hydroxylating dioxygenase subunit alpha [Sporichthya sp.]MBA3742748.1 aromatic ring-hydroxylating dioxygenase subunit alpha [Sporichthya sp.]
MTQTSVDRTAVLPDPSGGPTPYLSPVALVERIVAHIAAGTTDLGPRTGRVPVADYTDPARLAAELEMLRRVPVPFCTSAALTEPGSFVARDAAGVPLLAVRGRAGQVRVFRNACRHRSTALVEGAGCARSFVCPFHGWVYGLDGALSHVPDAYGFDGVELVDRGLAPVPCHERAGLVFVQQEGEADFSSVEQVPGLTDRHVLVETERIAVEGNWKVLTEGFLEGYHIRQTHKNTFFPMGYDNLTVLEHSGRHSRVTFPFRRVEMLGETPPEQWHLGKALTIVDHIFPNAIIARLTAHSAFVVVEPVSQTSSMLVISKIALPAEDGSIPEAVHRDISFVETGLLEDRAMAEGVQRGFAARTEDVVFGRYEFALTQLHEGLAAELEPQRPKNCAL